MGPCQGEKPMFSIPEKKKKKARSETSSPSGRVIELRGTDVSVTSSYLRLRKQHHQS